MSDLDQSKTDQSREIPQPDAETPSGTTQPVENGQACDGPNEEGESGRLPEILPDTFEDFIANGDVQTSPTNFFTGLFKKATDTLETSLQHAQQTSTEAITTAQTAGSSALSAVTGIVRDLGIETLQIPPPAITGFASTTRPLKSLRVPPTPILFLPPARVVCSSLICTVPPSGRVIEQSIAPDVTHTEPTQATCAFSLPDGQVILGLQNGGLRVLSLAGPVPALVCESGIEGSHATAFCSGDGVVAVGTHLGHTNVLKSSDLSRISTITPPDLCAVQLGAALRYAPVSSLSVCRDALLLVGYEDGSVKFSSLTDDFGAVTFVAHSQKVSGVLLFHDALAVTIGNASDASMAVFDAYTGRCLARRMLPYAPRSFNMNRFHRAKEEGLVCPSEMNFVVGGEDGQVQVFRLVVLSPSKVELHLIKTFSDRVRGRQHAVLQTVYTPEQALFVALSVNGEIRRWHVSKEDGCNLALLDEELSGKPVFTEENIVTAANQDFSLPDGNRLNSVGGVIKAQNILASLLDKDGIAEVEKDRLVGEFQQRQAAMLLATSQGDTELRRARRRIVGRFDCGLRASATEGTRTWIQLSKGAKRTAAFEIEFASRRHAERLREIQKSALADLRVILSGFLKRLPATVASSLEEVRKEVEGLEDCVEEEHE